MHKEYYEKYLREIRRSSERTIGHYFTSLNTISNILVAKGILKSSIYEVDSLSELEMLRDILKQDFEYIKKDKLGHNMYSAGLNNYIRFANGEFFDHTGSAISMMDIKVPVERYEKVSELYKRDRILVKQVMISADYNCELDKNHKTFISKSTNNQYIEGHHIISIRDQDKFDYSLDCYVNILGVCPTCHRKLHYGLEETRKPILNQLYFERCDRFYHSGLLLSHDEFVDLALGVM